MHKPHPCSYIKRSSLAKLFRRNQNASVVCRCLGWMPVHLVAPCPHLPVPQKGAPDWSRGRCPHHSATLSSTAKDPEEAGFCGTPEDTSSSVLLHNRGVGWASTPGLLCFLSSVEWHHRAASFLLHLQRSKEPI